MVHDSLGVPRNAKMVPGTRKSVPGNIPLVVPRNPYSVPRNHFSVPRNKADVPRNRLLSPQGDDYVVRDVQPPAKRATPSFLCLLVGTHWASPQP